MWGDIVGIESCARELQRRRGSGFGCRAVLRATRQIPTKAAVVVGPVSAIAPALSQWLFFGCASSPVAILSLLQAVLAPAVRYGKGPQVSGVSRAARLALSRMVAIEVRVFRSRIKGRGEDVGAASPESWGGFYVAEGPTDGLELLFANL